MSATIGMSSLGNDPLIVVGMHRSGTTLVSRLLQQMGGHLGADLSAATEESLSFQKSNIQLLHDCSASWHHPQPMREVLKDEPRVATLATRLHAEFLEFAETYHGGTQSALQTAFWGWKDPRSTLTLPIWRKVFPDSKVLHIVRNGVDVASSLVRRDRQGSPVTAALKTILVHVIPSRWPTHYQRSLEAKPDALTLDQAYQLWNDYLDIADASIGDVPKSHMLTLRYEDLLAEPLNSLRQIAEFVVAARNDSELSELAATINVQRRFAFVANPTLVDFYMQHRQDPQIAKYAYDEILSSML